MEERQIYIYIYAKHAILTVLTLVGTTTCKINTSFTQSLRIEVGRNTSTHSFFKVFMFHSCKYPSENPTARWLVLEMYCRAVAPTPLGPFSWRQRCLPSLVLTSLSLGISAGDLVTTCRSANRINIKGEIL